MNIPPLTKPFFSHDPEKEKRSIWLLITLAIISALILILAWSLTRSVVLARHFYGLLNLPLEILFRVFTFLGDDQFFMIFFSIIIWCVSKSLGFWSAFILLTSTVYSNLIKDLTALDRPPLPGVQHPESSYAFPDGHTLTAVTVWSYLAARLNKRGYCLRSG